MKKIAVLVMALALLLSLSVAQTKTPGVNERQVKQQRRIEQGIKSGELNKREARRLEKQEAKIQADKMKAKADGKVTKQERAKLRHEQNQTSRHIYKQKHDAQKRK